MQSCCSDTYSRMCCDILHIFRHVNKHCRGLYYFSSKISHERLASRPCVHNTVDTKYVILCSVCFIYEHSLRKYVTSLSVALTLHICRSIKQAVHCEMEVLRISYDIPFSLRRPQFHLSKQMKRT